MKLTKILLCITASAAILSGCASISDTGIASTSKTQAATLKEDMSLYKAFVKKDDNWLFSPYSIKDAFSLLYHGANEDVKKEFKIILGLDDDTISGIRAYDKWIEENENGSIKMANRAYVTNNEKISNKLDIDVLNLPKEDIADMDVSHPDKAAKKINDFVSETTNGKINNFISKDQINESTSMFMVNALYFNKEWDFQSGNIKWKDGKYYKAFCDYDYSLKNIKETEDKDIDILRLNYGNESNYAMTIITKSTNAKENKVDDFFENLQPGELQSILDFTNYSGLKEYDTCDFYVPNFEFSNKYSLMDELEELGMSAPFSGGFDALGPVSVSDVIHAAYIKTNEKGTEAAAATGIGLEMMSAETKPKKVKTVIADDTFIFIISDTDTDTVLFMGRVVTPSEPNE